MAAMRFSYAESMCDPSHYLPLAVAADACGWSSFCVPDSICYPEVSDSTYPYTPDGNREFLEGKPFIEPFSLIPAMGAVTENLRFTTFVMKLPIRNPTLVAKSAASVAVLTGNRFGFGVGLSPWPEDFVVTGSQWKARGARMDEMIEIIRGLCTGEYFEFHGVHYELPSIKICPVPTEPLPILIGGHAEPALRRAARIGDGWMPLVPPDDSGKSATEKIRQHLETAGRDPADFGIEPQARIAGGNPERWRKHAAGWRELGATHISIVTMGANLSRPEDHLKAASEWRDAIS